MEDINKILLLIEEGIQRVKKFMKKNKLDTQQTQFYEGVVYGLAFLQKEIRKINKVQ